jgi:GNAT superfamily N-acetyltransferase
MSLEIRQEAVTSDALAAHGTISIAFEVDRVLQVMLADGGLGGISLTETALSETTGADPYVKDHDASEGEGPARWAERFDLSNWGLLTAWHHGTRVGGAVIAFRTPDLYMLEGRDDVAVLWDLRVASERRGSGVGSALFGAVEDWAVARGADWLKIETQNVNTAACRFYVKMGCVLGGIDRFAYPDLPEEVRLLWWKRLQKHPQTRL